MWLETARTKTTTGLPPVMLFSRHAAVLVSGKSFSGRGQLWLQLFLLFAAYSLDRGIKTPPAAILILQGTNPPPVYNQLVKMKVEKVAASLWQSSFIVMAQEKSSFLHIDLCPQEGGLLSRRMIESIKVLQVGMSHKWFSVDSVSHQLSFLQMTLEAISAKA